MRTRRLLNAAAQRACFVLLLTIALPRAGSSVQGPVVEFVHTPPLLAPPGQPLQIRGQIYETPSLKELVLRFRSVGTPDWQEVDFVQESPDTWLATIPGSYVQPVGDILAMEYYVAATDFSDRTAEIYASEANPIRVPIDIPRPSLAGPETPDASAPAGQDETRPSDEPPGVDEPYQQPMDAGPALSARAPEETPTPAEKPAESPRDAGAEEAQAPAEPPPDAGSDEARATAEEPSPDAGAEETPPSHVEATENGAATTHDLPLEEPKTGPAQETKGPPTPPEAATPALPPTPPEPVIERVETSAQVTALGADLIRRLGLHTLADVAALLPGLSVSRDVQGFWHVSVDGRQDDAAVLVFYDGQRMNNPYDGRVNWEMSLENVERVLVQNSPSPVEYGLGALAVIQVIPTRREGLGAALQPGLDGAAVSAGALNASANGGTFWGRWKLFGDFDVALRGGYRAPIAIDAISPANAGTTNDERQFYGGGFRLENDLGGGATFFLNLRGSGEQRGALVGASDVAGPRSSLSWDTGFAEAGLRVPCAGWVLNGRLSYNDQYTNRSLEILPANAPGVGNAGDVALATAVNLSTIAAAFSALRPFSHGNLLTLGGTLEEQGITAFRESVSFDPNISSSLGDFNIPTTYPAQGKTLAWRSIGGVSVLDEWKPLEQVAVRGGVRGDLAGGVPGIALLPSAEAGLVWHVLPAFQLSATGSYASRLPTFEELVSIVPLPPTLSSGLATGYNATAPLKPMGLAHAELGGFFSREIVPEHHLVARVAGFYNRFVDPIEVVPNEGGFEVQNRPGGEQYFGLEGELRYSWARYFSAFGNVSWERGEDLAQAAALPQFSWLTTIPQLRVNGGILGALPQVGSLAVTVTYGSDRRNDTLTNQDALYSFDIPPYILLSATVRTVRFFGWLELALTVSGISVAGAYLDPVPRPDLMPGLLPREGVHGLLSARAFW